MKTTVSLHGAAGNTGAFTLIELLVVIAIIALLAGVATPVFQTAMMNGQEAAALQNARQIGIALHGYANDYNGLFPAGKNTYGQQIASSNDAFRSLIPNYLDGEQVFVVPRSVDGPKADNVINPSTEILKPGENHYAYVEGLNSSSNSLWPLVVDGASSQGTYTNVEGNPGGTWKGTKAIVINTDSSAHLVPLTGSPTSKIIPRFDDPTQDEMQVAAYMGNSVTVLQPAAN